MISPEVSVMTEGERRTIESALIDAVATDTVNEVIQHIGPKAVQALFEADASLIDDLFPHKAVAALQTNPDRNNYAS